MSLCVASAGAQQSGVSQPQTLTVTPANLHPEGAAVYEAVARFRLASRKTTYRLGELISVDFALLNYSKESLFILSDFSPSFRVLSKSGNEVHVIPYGIFERVVDASSYTLTEPNDFIVKSSLILVGCDAEAFRGDVVGSKSVDLFNQNRFVSRGSACLQIERAGTYLISAEITNSLVVLSSEGPNARTTVGAIRSNTLRVLVTK